MQTSLDEIQAAIEEKFTNTTSSINANSIIASTKRVLKDTSNALEAVERLFQELQSSRLVIEDVFGKTDEHTEFFHASLHLLDQITEGISNATSLGDDITNITAAYTVSQSSSFYYAPCYVYHVALIFIHLCNSIMLTLEIAGTCSWHGC